MYYVMRASAPSLHRDTLSTHYGWSQLFAYTVYVLLNVLTDILYLVLGW